MKYETYRQPIYEEASSPDGDGGGGGTLLSDSPPAGDPPPAASPDSTGDTTAPSGDSPPPAVQDGPWFSDFIAHDGALNKDRLENLPEELKPFKETLERYDTLDAMLRGFHNSRQLNGAKGLEPLPPGASEDAVQERAELMAKLNNAPSEPAGYKFEKPDGYPEDLAWNQEGVDRYAEILHKHNASPELAAELFQAQMEDAGQSVADMHAELHRNAAEGKQALTDLVKAEGLSYEDVIQEARRGLDLLGWEGFDANNPVMNNPHVIRLLSEHAKALGEDNSSLPGDSSDNGDFRQQARDIVFNTDNPLHAAYHNEEHVNHDAAVAEKQRLDRLARR